MRISVLVYDSRAVDRIRKRVYRFLEQYGEIYADNNILWSQGMYIEIYQTLIIINISEQDHNIEINDYLQSVLKDEEVTINMEGRMEYSTCYGDSPQLSVVYT